MTLFQTCLTVSNGSDMVVLNMMATSEAVLPFPLIIPSTLKGGSTFLKGGSTQQVAGEVRK